ncbi:MULTISPECIES: flagellin [Comamonas]|uniref:flagellin N-terminal helical domain-containing protein n=1 Tax=Comamonas TaxID=283 RepID=UPI00257F67B5|nr:MULTISPECIES: flagellin [Comamonas]
MAMTINTNIVSVNAQRNLGLSGNSLSTSMQRLSSGLRVNSAKDDAAGLAIAERMNAQSKGLAVAARNANDGISLAQTAEGALGKVGDMLQRMRELAVQSSNATNSADDRKALQAEVNQLRSEIDRVAKTTSFNGQKILDGSFAGGVFQVGAGAGDNITVGAITNGKASALSNVTFGSSTSAKVQASDVSAYGTKIDKGSLQIRVGSAAAVDLGEIAEASSGQERMGQVIAAINAKTADTGVTAFLEGDVDSGFTMQLRSASGESVSLEGFNTAQTGFGSAVTVGVSAANATTYTTNIAEVSTWSSETAANLLTDLVTTPTAATPGFNTGNAALTALTGLFGAGAAGKADFDAAYASFQAAVTGNLVDHDTNTTDAVYDFKFTAEGAANVQKAAVEFRAAIDAALWKNGEANRDDVYAKLDALNAADGAGFNAARGDLTTALTAAGMADVTAITAVTATGTSTPEAVKAAKASVMGMVDDYMSGKLGINSTAEAQMRTGIETLNVSTQAGAWEALQKIDSAIDQVNSARADLGALQTRFEKSIENIDIMNENISAARGRIVDADFASETANLSRAQILQQAGTAMVAQANQLPQQVLSLLQ